LVKSPRAFYCPVQLDPRFQYNTTENPWNPDPPFTGNLRAGFTTRPVVNWIYSGSTAFWPATGCPKMSKMKNVAIVCDATGVVNNSATRVKFLPHKTSLNVLYGDRSAKAITLDRDIIARVDKITNQTTALALTDLLNPTDPTNPGLWDMFDKHNK